MAPKLSNKTLDTIEKISAELTSQGELSLHFKPTTVSKSLVSWYQNSARELPWRTLYSKTNDPYVVWISEIMLQQTVIGAVIPKYIAFMEQFPTISDLAKATEEDLQKAVAGLGYYRRFRMMREAAVSVYESQAGFPSTYADAIKLKGVGEYTASAVSSICFGETESVVDGNVERVMCRIFDLRVAPNIPALKKIFKKTLNKIIDKNYPGDFNQGIMELGQLVCTPQNPKCSLCPVAKTCLAKKNSSTDIAPGKKLKKSFQNLNTVVTISKNKGHIFLEKRDNTSKFLSGLEGFPIEVVEKNPLSSLGEFKHTITNHKLTNYVVIKESINKPTKAGRWVPISHVEEEITTSFDKKAFNSIRQAL
jgi:A/G-specific adenine glycosylase